MVPIPIILTKNVFFVIQITTYAKSGSDDCVAFLTNNNTREDRTIKFRGVDYFLPAKSISILPDCKTVVYNTQTVKLTLFFFLYNSPNYRLVLLL